MVSELSLAVVVYKVLNRVQFDTGSELGDFGFPKRGWVILHLTLIGLFLYFLKH